MNEDLRKWFGTGGEGGVGGGGWDEYNTKGERTGKCARGKNDDGKGPKPKCLSKEKAAKMSKDEIAAAVRRKREKDPVADRPGKGGKPKMVSNNIGEEKNQKDHEYSMARSELATIENAVKRLKEKMKGEGNIEAWVQSKITKAADYIDSAADYVDSGEHDSQESMDESKKSPCWKGYRKKSGTADYEEGSCVKVSEASFEISPRHREKQRETKIRKRALSGDEGSQIALKKVKGPNAPLVRPGDTKIRNINAGYEPSIVEKILLEMEAEVLTEKNKPTNPKLWAKWKSKAKAKFDVYPSAYANGWAAKGYKSEGGGWKSVSEETIEDLNGNSFVEVVDLIKPDPLVSESCCSKCGKEPCECETKKSARGGSSAKPGPDKNYVKPMSEAVRIPAKTGNIVMVTLNWRGKYYGIKMFFPQTTKPNRKEVQDQIEKVYPGGRVQSYYVSDIEPGEQFLQVEDWQKVNRQDKTDGLSQKAVDAYRRENPGSKLQTAVTEKNPEGKRAKRRAGFCWRMKGMKSKLTSAKTARDPDSRINKALRRWRCN